MKESVPQVRGGRRGVENVRDGVQHFGNHLMEVHRQYWSRQRQGRCSVDCLA